MVDKPQASRQVDTNTETNRQPCIQAQSGGGSLDQGGDD
jgi:hypothetical protein